MASQRGGSPAAAPVDRILKVATATFAMHGFRGTSTRDIAQRAKVNEVTIFRLFRNKQTLFRKVIESNMRDPRNKWVMSVLRSASDEKVLFSLLTKYLHEMLDPTFLRLLFFAALEQPKLVKKYVQPRIAQFYEILDEHLSQRARAGDLRFIDFKVAGRALIAMVAYHRIFYELIGTRNFGYEAKPPIQKYIDIWTRGVNGRSMEHARARVG